ncbi:MAG: LysE family transporter [Bacteroidaceae bacterium]|nr:LysE family transporter [Bacteroidaceae bacterium]MBO7240116.1 LysE family transporter [Bacteroidaceae bacterium]
MNDLLSQVVLLEIIVKGVVIGIVASAPMGPVGVLCIQRTLNKGRAYGLVTGVGAALSDILYALITGYGLSLLYDVISNPTTIYWMQLIGAVIMFIFGLHTYRTNPVRNTRNVSRNKSSLLRNGVTGFFITLANPMIILLFLALFTPFNFVMIEEPMFYQFIGYLSIFGGAMLWWLFITFVVNKLRTRFDVRGIWIINRVIGGAVMIGSLVGAVLIATGTLSLH